jgi:hypothetical protein
VAGDVGLQLSPQIEVNDADGDTLYVAITWGDGTNGEIAELMPPYVMPLSGHAYGWSGAFVLTIGVSDLQHPPLVQTFAVNVGTPSDADADGLPDDYEESFPCLEAAVPGATNDADLDGVTALEEYAHGSNACAPDTDGDGYDDASDAFSNGAAASAYCFIMRADVDALNDGVVTILDLSEIAAWFTEYVPPAPERYDQDGDAQIVILDLAIAGTFFGKTIDGCPI